MSIVRACFVGMAVVLAGATALAQSPGQPPPGSGEEPGTSSTPPGEPAPSPGETPQPQPGGPGSSAESPAESPPPPSTVESSGEAPSSGGWLFGRHVSLTAGLGMLSYTNARTRDFIGPALSYTVRLLVGSRSRVGYELAYIGSAASISALGLQRSAVVVSNGAEAAVRLNFTKESSWQPYVLAGAAWRHYALTRATVNQSVVNGSDNVLEIPLAAGITWRTGGIVVVDARIAYRAATGEDLLGGPMGGGPGLSSWNATLKAGLEF